MAREVLPVRGTMMRKIAWVMAGILSGEACAQHVQLPSLPDPHAPITLRLRTYQRLRSVAVREDSVLLGNDLSVTRPEDLIPAVRPTSATVRHAQRFVETQSRVDVWTGIAMGGLLLGVVTSSVGLSRNPTRLFPDPRPPEERDGPGLLVATAIGLIAATIGIIVVYTFRPRANAARAAAFRSYDAELRERLDFCGDPASIRYCADAGEQPDAFIP